MAVSPDNLHVALASITSDKSDRVVDRACLIAAGEHPSVRHASFIAYNHTEILEVAEIRQLMDTGQCTQADIFAPALLQRIVAGAVASNRTPEKVVKFVQGYS